MPKALWILFFAFLSLSGHAQQSPEKKKTFTVYLNYTDYSVKAEVLQVPAKLHSRSDYTYSWYASNRINETQGGFDGRLLHGWYTASYLDNKLKEKGRYSKGLREGEWTSWHANGKIYEKTNYCHGLRHGKFESFDASGHPMLLAHYRNGKLHGTFITYNAEGKEILRRTYKHGEEEIVKPKAMKENKPGTAEKKEHSSLSQRWKNLFKKKEKTPESQTPKEKKKSPEESSGKKQEKKKNKVSPEKPS